MNLAVPLAVSGIVSIIGMFRGDPSPTMIEIYILVAVSVASYNAYMGNK